MAIDVNYGAPPDIESGLPAHTACLWALALLVLNPRCITAVSCWTATGPAWPHDLVELTQLRCRGVVPNAWSLCQALRLNEGSVLSLERWHFQLFLFIHKVIFTVQSWNNMHKIESRKKLYFLKGGNSQKLKNVKILISPHIWIIILCFVFVNFVLEIKKQRSNSNMIEEIPLFCFMVCIFVSILLSIWKAP